MSSYVYIMASQKYGTLYTGVTADIVQRSYEHREGLVGGFTKKYNCKVLVWYEEFDDITLAIQREKNIKRYYRQWKINLINEMNPDWNDLYETFNC